MSGRAVIATILYFASIAGPTVAGYMKYGLHTRADPESADQMVFLALAMAFTFVVALIGSWVSRPSPGPVAEAAARILEAVRDERGRGRGPA